MNSQAARNLALVTIPMLIIFALKLLCIWFFTSRIYSDAHGTILGYPYDSLVFDTPDRYTDWLLPAAQAKPVNPYDLAALQTLHLPNWAPYGYLCFLLLKLANVFGPYAIFLMSIAGYVYLNFLILRTRLSASLLICLNAFMALLIGCYPLYLEIDRGNTAIGAALALSALFLGFTKKINGWGMTVILAVIACLKPSFLLFVLPIIAVCGWPQVLTGIAIVGANYAIPLFLPGGRPDYLIAVIRLAHAASNPGFGAIPSFAHNVSSALRALGMPSFSLVVAALLLTPLIYTGYRIRHSRNPWEYAPLLITLTMLTSLLIADPSFDYELLLLLPVFLYVLEHEMERRVLWKSSGAYLIVGFVLAMSFINMPFPGIPSFTGVLRCVGLGIWYVAIATHLFIFLGEREYQIFSESPCPS